MNFWKKWLVHILKLKGTLDTELALRTARKHGFDAGYEHGVADGLKLREQFTPSVFTGQKQAQIGAYDPPSPTTDGKMRASLPSDRDRQAMKDFLGVQTSELPRMPGDLRRIYTTRKLKPLDGPPLHFETTQMRIPTWML
jgi:hypothetical protein